MEIRAAILRTLARNRVTNKALNGIGYVARGFYGDYAIGRSRSLAEIAPHLSRACTIEIGSDGIILDHTRKLSTNTFLIEAFLKQAITKIEIKDELSYGELARISRGALLDEPTRINIKKNEDAAAETLPGISKHNNEEVMRLNALTALYGGIGYSAYKIAVMAASLGTLGAVDILCGSVITVSTVLFCAVNIIKQKFVADSTKYTPPPYF